MQHLAGLNLLAAARRVAVLLTAVLLVPWPSHFPLQLQQQSGQNTAVSSSHRLVAGQGLLVGPESLGAGEVAVAQTFDQFKDMLAVAAQLSGKPDILQHPAAVGATRTCMHLHALAVTPGWLGHA